MKRVKWLLLLLAIGCGGGGTAVNQFAGTWSGVWWDGQDDGTIGLVIQQNGNTTGSLFSNDHQQTCAVNGDAFASSWQFSYLVSFPTGNVAWNGTFGWAGNGDLHGNTPFGAHFEMTRQ